MADEPANAARKQRGKPFQPGQSGNPAGKAKGTRHRATMAVEALLDGQTKALTQKCIDMALAGDATAMRMPLTAAERARLDAGEPEPVTTLPLAGLSREAIEWLAYDREAVRHA